MNSTTCVAGDLLYRPLGGTTRDAWFWCSRLMVSGANSAANKPTSPPPAARGKNCNTMVMLDLITRRNNLRPRPGVFISH